MNVMVQTLGKRAACDRCHALKMRCVVEDTAVSGRCNRCRGARVACKYSAPGKPGRPPTDRAKGLTANHPPGPRGPTSTRHWGPGGAPQLSNRLQSQLQERLHLDGIEAAGYAECSSPTLSVLAAGVGQGNDCWLVAGPLAALSERAPIAPQPDPCWPDPLSLRGEESCALSPWGSWAIDKERGPGSQGTAELGNYDTEDDHIAASHFQGGNNRSILTQSPPSQGQSPIGTLSEPPTSAMTSASSTALSCASSTIGYNNQKYLQQLSELNARLSSPVALNPDDIPSRPLSPDGLSQAVAHVLESSTLFLDLARIRPSCRAQRDIGASEFEPELDGAPQDTWQRRQPADSVSVPASAPFESSVTAYLQLLVSYMRVTELHHGLYAAIYSYLGHSTTDTNEPGRPGAERRPLLALSIAGVRLAPHPRFELQLLLQTSTHYLARIQECLNIPASLRLTGPGTYGCGAPSPGSATAQSGVLGMTGSAEASILMHTLMLPDQERRMKGVTEILERLKDEFGISI